MSLAYRSEVYCEIKMSLNGNQNAETLSHNYLEGVNLKQSARRYETHMNRKHCSTEEYIHTGVIIKRREWCIELNEHLKRPMS